ncbi:MAG: Protein-disulfide isomerase [Candidatus Peregrinibacteria bacterium Greene0416_19]|nr:MAG: Protein-disulfide isomerase [Candidatus Peregrinibacteria bacterium Greene0416_19]
MTMCSRRFAIIALALLLSSCGGPATNPDPNHTHADFGMWVDGREIDFSAETYMSGSSAEEQDDGHGHTHRHPSLHLHDGNGHVIHRHKPGLPFKEFSDSIGLQFRGNTCYSLSHPGKGTLSGSGGFVCPITPLRLFVNDMEQPFDLRYVFKDLDRIFITNAPDRASVDIQMQHLTDDACLYSRTCPERGDPPSENCIADPAVPCVEN